MNLTSGIIEIDLHGLRTEEAVKRAKSEVNKASGSVYIIRLIHGYHGGTRIREAIEDEFSYGREEKVKKIRQGSNPGITEMVLREICAKCQKTRNLMNSLIYWIHPSMLSSLVGPEYLQRVGYPISGARTVCITGKIRSFQGTNRNIS